LKNRSNKNQVVVAYTGPKSVLAKSFVKHYRNKFIFKSYTGDVRDYKSINLWLKKNTDINIFINFAAITSNKNCEKDKKKALDVNYKSITKLLNLINKIPMKNFNYFLSISSSHVFKKSNSKLSENSIKKPLNYYGITKLALENYIFKNQNKFRFKIGIARIFNYYNKGQKKGFFINDVIKRLKENKKIIKFNNVNAYRDFISMKDINIALFKMINLKLTNDYNICSGKKVFLPDIINHLSKIYKKKVLIINSKKSSMLIGSNAKLRKKGWKITNKKLFNELYK
tara:strand:- start:2970 stop:3821 length:852 start_codon:yes stop_codon:yes gene_type:complete